jgi:hypothetical protein
MATCEIEIESGANVTEGDYCILYHNTGKYLGVIHIVTSNARYTIVDIGLGINSYMSDINLGTGLINLSAFTFNNYDSGMFTLSTTNTSIITVDNGLGADVLFRQIVRTKNFIETHDIEKLTVDLRPRPESDVLELRLDDPYVSSYELLLGSDNINAVELVSKATGLKKVWCIDSRNVVVAYSSAVRLLPEKRKCVDVENDADVNLSNAQKELRSQSYGNQLEFSVSLNKLQSNLLSYLGRKLLIHYPKKLNSQINEISYSNGLITFTCGLINTKLTDRGDL